MGAGGNKISGENNSQANVTNHISLSNDGIKWLIVGLIVLIVTLLSTGAVSLTARNKVDFLEQNIRDFKQETDDRVFKAENEARQAAYWLNAADASCTQAGHKDLPQNPFAKR